MSKKTMFDTRFWSDSYVSELDPVEKLVFNYVLTNSHISLCGIYELPIKIIALETGIDREMIPKLFKRFEKDNKIVYKDGWICVVNYPKHQNYNKTTMIKALQSEIKQIPLVLLNKFITYGYPIHTLCIGYKDKEQVKDKEKDMGFNKFSDDYEEGIVDLDGDGSLHDPKQKDKDKNEKHRKIKNDLIHWLIDRQGRDPKRTNRPKQLKALNELIHMQVSPKEIKQTIMEMEGEKYWSDKLPDFRSVVSRIQSRG